MNQFKYSLDKSSKKFKCPKCHKLTLVRYMDNDKNIYLDNNEGRCDRESKCQYHLKPNGKNTLIVSANPIRIEPNNHNINLLSFYGNNYSNNNFIKYLLQYFAPVDVITVIKKYFIGTSTHWNGSTIFWQVDAQMNVCGGKVMLYEASTGKRVKQPYTHINWMHKVLSIQDFVLQQCLFGLHNLCDYSQINIVCIVESEKTAIIMSILYPGYLWLATGSKSNLKESLLNPIKKYNIIVFPDKTDFNDWNLKVEIFIKNGFCIKCSNLLESKNLKKGDDLADFLTQ